MEQLAYALMLWGAQAVGLPPPAELPAIEEVPRCEIAKMFDENVDCERDGLMAEAVYVRGTIYLPAETDWDRPTLRSQSILLHELVHHVQITNGVHARIRIGCSSAAIEAPAYGAQIKYLLAAGVKEPLRYMGLTQAQLAMLTTCKRI